MKTKVPKIACALFLYGCIWFCCALLTENMIVMFLFMEGFFSTAYIAVFSLMGGNPDVLGKTSKGQLPWWSFALYWSYHLCMIMYNRGFDRIRRQFVPETDVSEVHPCYFLGGILAKNDMSCDDQTRICAVVDCTLEFSRVSFVYSHGNGSYSDAAYLSIPAWDGSSPTVQQINKATEFVRDNLQEMATNTTVPTPSTLTPTTSSKLLYNSNRQNSPSVFVHCAYGRGRSVCVMCAVLVAQGIFPNWQLAYDHIKRVRPRVELVKSARETLDTWQQAWSAKK